VEELQMHVEERERKTGKEKERKERKRGRLQMLGSLRLPNKGRTTTLVDRITCLVVFGQELLSFTSTSESKTLFSTIMTGKKYTG
jgi:hypothetical protein